MGNHIDIRDSRKQKIKEGDVLARKRRASFKQYLVQIEEDLRNEDMKAELTDLPDDHYEEVDEAA